MIYGACMAIEMEMTLKEMEEVVEKSELIESKLFNYCESYSKNIRISVAATLYRDDKKRKLTAAAIKIFKSQLL